MELVFWSQAIFLVVFLGHALRRGVYNRIGDTASGFMKRRSVYTAREDKAEHIKIDRPKGFMKVLGSSLLYVIPAGVHYISHDAVFTAISIVAATILVLLISYNSLFKQSGTILHGSGTISSAVRGMFTGPGLAKQLDADHANRPMKHGARHEISKTQGANRVIGVVLLAAATAILLLIPKIIKQLTQSATNLASMQQAALADYGLNITIGGVIVIALIVVALVINYNFQVWARPKLMSPLRISTDKGAVRNYKTIAVERGLKKAGKYIIAILAMAAVAVIAGFILGGKDSFDITSVGGFTFNILPGLGKIGMWAGIGLLVIASAIFVNRKLGNMAVKRILRKEAGPMADKLFWASVKNVFKVVGLAILILVIPAMLCTALADKGVFEILQVTQQAAAVGSTVSGPSDFTVGASLVIGALILLGVVIAILPFGKLEDKLTYFVVFAFPVMGITMMMSQGLIRVTPATLAGGAAKVGGGLVGAAASNPLSTFKIIVSMFIIGFVSKFTKPWRSGLNFWITIILLGAIGAAIVWVKGALNAPVSAILPSAMMVYALAQGVAGNEKVQQNVAAVGKAVWNRYVPLAPQNRLIEIHRALIGPIWNGLIAGFAANIVDAYYEESEDNLRAARRLLNNFDTA